MRIVFSTLCALSLLASAGCRDKDSANDLPDAGPADANQSETTIYDVQNESMPVDTPVTLRGVVVVAIDNYGDSRGSIYVMEEAGGPFSGVYVRLQGTEAAGLAVGDLVDVEGGVKAEFAWSTDTSGLSVTQIEAPDGGSITLTKVGSGTVPAPEVLNPWDLAADPAEAEKWEGVLIKFENVAVLSAPYAGGSDPTRKDMEVTGPYVVQSTMTELADSIAEDDCFASITGMGDYFFEYRLQPRTAADLETGGTGCPAQEEGATACGDGDDNDYDGYADCQDHSCQDTVAACVVDTTVVAIQDETVTLGTRVNLTDVVVTGVDFNRRNLWVADASAGAQYNGVYVHRGFGGTAELPVNIEAGVTVDITGRVAVYKGLTQIADPTVTFKSGGADNGTPVTGLDAATLTDDANGEPYEGVIVQIGASQVAQMSVGFNAFTVNDGTGEIVIDGDILAYTPGSATECYSTITGILHHDEVPTSSGTYVRAIEIRSNADVVTTTCP